MTMPRRRLFVAAPILISVAVILGGCSGRPSLARPWSLDELEVQVFDTTREVAFTNKQAGFYDTESNAPQRNGWQGWHIMSQRMMADYRIAVDGRPLDRAQVHLARVLPHQLKRSYTQGVQETFTVLDSLNALVISLQNVRGSRVSASPVFDHTTDTSAFDVEARNGIVLVAQKRHLQRSAREDYPVWIGMTFASGVAIPSTGTTIEGRRAAAGSVDVDITSGQAVVLVFAGDTREQVVASLTALRTGYGDLVAARRARMERLLRSSHLRTGNDRFDRAMAWAKLSLDALIMHQGRTGIYAGLPWFSNYWGRDTFISLPGATLVTGEFTAAREILTSFATWQKTDPASPDEGRIPNLVTPTSTSYNTADGTPWFVLGVFEYVRASGDTAFAREMYPVLRRAVEGALRHRVDPEGFLTHGDAETWMDAVGPEGPWSPRGNRANDIQALWYRQLLVSTSYAELFGDRDDADRWNSVAQRLLVNFHGRFVDERNERMVDHLRADGSADTTVRPNQFFALDIVFDPKVRERIYQHATEQLVAPWGVLSLSSSDPAFHPWHDVPQYYPKDAAYHNGVVWTWLAGSWIAATTSYGKPNLAYRLTDNMVHQILDRGAVGTMSELLDAVPRPGEQEPRPAGTFSQTWSLAEFVRTAYHSYLGVSVDATNRQLWLLPQLPAALPGAEFDVPIGEAVIRVSYARKENGGTVGLTSVRQSQPVSVNIGWPVTTSQGRSCSFMLQPGQQVSLDLTAEGVRSEARDPSSVHVESEIQSLQQFPELDSLRLSVPVIPPGLSSLRSPGHPMLSNAEVTSVPVAPRTVVDRSDVTGDDRGPGTFVYPTTPALRRGSLDLTRFTVTAGDSLVRFNLAFAALSDPGWHPEYGFQLTYMAIAVDKDGTTGSGRRDVGRGSAYRLPPDRAAEEIVYVGGGIRVEDANGNVVAEYVPQQGDERRPIGNAAEARVSFSLPVRLIGSPTPGWRWTVLIGAQDDHGGAGIGDFRSVEATAGEWVGGGRTSAGQANVYDVLTIP